MEVIKEGTHTCLLQRIVDNEVFTEDKVLEYYLSVEYEVLKRNSLKTLIPVQLREKDGEKSLLFDITGKQPLKKREKERGFTQKECEKLLQGIIDLLGDIDNYMLDLNCVEFCPEYIYIGASGETQWIYCPQTILLIQEESDLQSSRQVGLDFQDKIESFFAWMLTQIDYEDTKAVQFIYRFYDKIRKLGFSKELLERYILSENIGESHDTGELKKDKEELERRELENVEVYNDKIHKEREELNDGRVSYESFFQEDLKKKRQTKEWEREDKQKRQNLKNKKEYKAEYRKRRKQNNSEWREKGKQNKQKIIYICLSVLFLIVGIGALGLEIFFVYSGIQGEFTELLFRYSIGGGILILTCIFGIMWSVGRIRIVQDISNKKEYIKNVSKEKEYVKGKGSNEKRMIKTEVEWEEDGEGTTILSGDNGINNISDNYLCPMLREEETGIIYLVKDCPFYIGSAGGNQLEIQDKTVSREHAIILESIRIDGSEGYTIQDMNSTNGTWINDKKMRKGSQAKLKDGTIIRFAQKEYKFLLQDI